MSPSCAKVDVVPQGSEGAAFEAIYRAMLPTVHRFVANRLGESEAEDVVAEVFFAAAVAFTDGRHEQVSDAWLMAVARNKVIDRWRKAERRSAIALRNRARAEEYVAFPADWAADPRRENVLAALERCTPAERMLLVLHYLDGMPAPALAQEMECSVSAIESRLARARRSFRSVYDREVSDG